MDNEKLIEKAKLILDHFEISYENKDVSIYKPDKIVPNPFFESIGLESENLDTYDIFFRAIEQIIPGVNVPLIALTVDRKTDKIIELITKHNLYKVPDELQ